MKKIIELISTNILISDCDDFVYKYMFSVCLLFLFFIDNKLSLNDQNIYQIYLNYMNKYIQYNVNIDILSKEIFHIIVDYFININFDIIINELKNNNLIEQIYDFTKNNKQYKSVSKFLELHMVNYKIINDTKKYFCLENVNSILLLFSGIGELFLPLLNIKYNELYSYDKNKNINLLFILNIKISYGLDIEKNVITSDVIDDNSINKKVDLIICNIPQNFKNIIYANCNNTIKNLKIRGTKAEPLILQLISQLVNKNGKIILYTPSSLLFSESNQHVETRKYLVDNFNIEKIIELENKKSLIIIKNNKEVNNIQIIKNNIIFNVNKENINKENYLLDFYEINNEINTYYEKKKLNELILIKTKNDLENNKIINKILYNYKFNDFNIDLLTNIKDYNYLFLTKDNSIIKQDFLNLCLIHFFNKNLEKISKGKMNKISLDLIYELELTVLPIKTQELILHQIELNNTIINNNDLQIKNFVEILNKFIEGMIIDAKKKNINCFFNIYNEINKDSIIAIKKNSLAVGTIYKIDNIDNYKDNTNFFYLNILNKNDNINYFYYLIKYYKTEFINSAFKNKSIGLSKNFIELFEIPILLKEEQDHLISICEYFYKQIEILENNTNLLKETNIISLIV